MHQCVKTDELKYSTLCKSSGRDHREEVCCSICRIIFCCSKHREVHEDDEHGRQDAETARQQRQIRKEKKPLACLICCRVFTSGLFVNESCKTVSKHEGTDKDGGTSHILIIIPEWAVAKYLFPNNKKRSWHEANDEESPKVEIQVQSVVEKIFDANTVQDSSFTQKSSIQSILTKQRKTELSVKRDRRVTFSPVTAVAITSRESIIKVVSRKTRGEPSPNTTSETPSTLALNSVPLSIESTAPAKAQTDLLPETSPLLPKADIRCKASAFSPLPDHDGKEDGVFFSPPLPNESTNGSPMLAPQMSSTPVSEHVTERRSDWKSDSSSGQQTSLEAGGANEGIFSSLANIICCAFQALPSVLNQFFATFNETDGTETQMEESSVGRERRQRRRSATFTPYVPISIKKRRLNNRPIIKTCSRN